MTTDTWHDAGLWPLSGRICQPCSLAALAGQSGSDLIRASTTGGPGFRGSTGLVIGEAHEKPGTQQKTTGRPRKASLRLIRFYSVLVQKKKQPLYF